MSRAMEATYLLRSGGKAGKISAAWAVQFGTKSGKNCRRALGHANNGLGLRLGSKSGATGTLNGHQFFLSRATLVPATPEH